MRERQSNRRRFLQDSLYAMAGGTWASLGSRLHAAQGTPNPELDRNHPSLFCFSRLRYPSLMRVQDNWDAWPDADEMFLRYLRRVSSVKLSPLSWRQRVIDVTELGRVYDAPERESPLFTRPFLFMTGESRFHLDHASRQTLGEYFRRGGFLWGDDCVERYDYSVQTLGEDHFFLSFCEYFSEILPGARMQDIPFDHPLYHCVFDFSRGSPRLQGQPHRDKGLFYQDRMVAMVTAGDIHCGWKHHGRLQKYYQFALNIVIYALTH